ncbi:MAG TPA: AmmeMemoRadiSam system protein A [Acetomicrobium flavidum]|uniref:AmmeMemoRadiSam system protein A n=1 Tax=Acetomicrobium flavidum TaxID=49896 RepID=UPI002CFA46AB|nr:AmmeMemoRadiSam system protein A [Acetomicrobium flavidum]HOP87320.1 AmmeMemoRadiSam system protein A [Acetomicrobium flavidum]
MWRWAIFVPHPPIIIPEVGRGEEAAAAKTIEGMKEIAKRLKDELPDSLIILTPHHAMGRGLHVICANQFKGDMGMFRARNCRLEVDGDPELASSLAEYMESKGLPVSRSKGRLVELDHASFVPLYYLNKTWGTLPKVVIANPLGLDYEESYALGKFLRQFDANDKNLGIIFSGDLSHRLIPSAPAGYHPRAKDFDAAVVRAFETSNAEELLSLPEDEIERAGECGLRSALAFLGMAEGEPISVLSYEGPFGVGYCTAIWMPTNAAKGGSSGVESHPYVRLARLSVEHYLKTKQVLDPSQAFSLSPQVDLWSKRRGCFVSIKRLDGSLRGCIGTISPVRENLASEIIYNALAAAFEDPRFMPLSEEELAGVRFSVDVLSDLELVASVDELDPKVYGVVVEKGLRKGVLLPDLEGVDTVEYQLEIAAQKAGISSLKGAKIYRFTVERYEEVEKDL